MAMITRLCWSLEFEAPGQGMASRLLPPGYGPWVPPLAPLIPSLFFFLLLYSGPAGALCRCTDLGSPVGSEPQAEP